MTNTIIEKLEVIFDEVKTALTPAVETVEADVSATYTKYLPAFKAWCATMDATVKGQGEVILEQGLQDIGQLILTGGNPTAAIATLVPQVISQVKTDLNTDVDTVVASAKNAAYTAVGLAIAALPAPATAPTAAPAA